MFFVAISTTKKRGQRKIYCVKKWKWIYAIKYGIQMKCFHKFKFPFFKNKPHVNQALEFWRPNLEDVEFCRKIIEFLLEELLVDRQFNF